MDINDYPNFIDNNGDEFNFGHIVHPFYVDNDDIYMSYQSEFIKIIEEKIKSQNYTGYDKLKFISEIEITEDVFYHGAKHKLWYF